MIKIAGIFFLGVVILVAAIAMNFFAKKVGLVTWYDFLSNPQHADVVSYVWLFFLYPLGLGVAAYVFNEMFPL